MKEQIEVITYEQERLNYFTNLMNKAQKRYKRLFKKFKDAPYLSAESEMLSDAGRETHFHGDVVEMLEKGYHRQSEWISVEDRLPEVGGTYLIVLKEKHECEKEWNYHVDVASFIFEWDCIFHDWDEGQGIHITHWMPLPEPPKMKGGAE